MCDLLCIFQSQPAFSSELEKWYHEELVCQLCITGALTRSVTGLSHYSSWSQGHRTPEAWSQRWCLHLHTLSTDSPCAQDMPCGEHRHEAGQEHVYTHGKFLRDMQEQSMYWLFSWERSQAGYFTKIIHLALHCKTKPHQCTVPTPRKTCPWSSKHLILLQI